MLKRPKPGEDEEDLLQMQEEFFRQKKINPSLQSAAQVTNLRGPYSQTTNRNSDVNSARKQSKYANSKGLKIQEISTQQCCSAMGDILEKTYDECLVEQKLEIDDDKVYYPKVIPAVLGNIVEKNSNTHVNLGNQPMPSLGFPIATKRDVSKKSIYAKKVHQARQKMEIDEPHCSQHNDVAGTLEQASNSMLNLPKKSFMVSSKEAEQIHTENVDVLNKMSEKEILEEQQKLLTTLDPKLVEFIKARRKQQDITNSINDNKDPKKDLYLDEPIQNTRNQLDENDSLWDNDVFSHPNVDEWLNFDSLEKDKLEWIRGIQTRQKLHNNEPYEARFNFKGYLMPYTLEYTEDTKTLFHHGEEPHRPGYTLTELFELCRSTIIQQRVMALNTIAGVLEYFSAGTYKGIIDIPLSKIFFIIRISVDENKVIILEPALKCMRNLVYNRIDEASLDALTGFEEGTQQPCLENDKSEIAELDAKESELKDFHLAEIDIIAALLRTDIIQRLYYILDIVKPTFNCVQFSLQILTRLARDSLETAYQIVQSDHLMKTIVKYFVPVTSINFHYSHEATYNGKPLLAALKLLRVLCLQTKEIGIILINNYDILRPVSEYISSGIDGTHGLRLQIEAFCIFSNLLTFGIGTENAASVIPIVVTALYKHVNGTDVFVNSSVLSATHAAVVIQFVNKILICNLSNTDNFKHQIYPLLKQGVQKWIAQLSLSDVYTCGHLRLLCSALDCCRTIMLIEQLPIKILSDSLKTLASSKGYKNITKQLIPSSNLLSGIENRDLHVVKNLMSLGGSLIDSEQKVLPILNVASPIPFLASVFKVLECIDNKDVSFNFLKMLTDYLEQFSKKVPSLCDNWFTRVEIDFVSSLVRVCMKEDLSEENKDLLYAVASKLCYILRIDKKYELNFLFSNIVFNNNWITAERLLKLMSLSDSGGFSGSLYVLDEIKLCYSSVVNLDYVNTAPNIELRKWREPILPRDWIYLPILNLYSKNQETGNKTKQVKAAEARQKEFIISCSLEWILFNEVCFGDLLQDIDITDRFCRIMCVFLCDNSLFLDAKIKTLLQMCVQMIFKKEKKRPFNFNKQLMGLSNFQDFYTQLLEQFQSVSYGDSTFAACLLVPLAQIHDVKWRKLLWSEYAGCLRALDCPEDQLCYALQSYLYPVETDDSLLKSYCRALSSNLLRPNTTAYQIASHHVNCFKSKLSQNKT